MKWVVAVVVILALLAIGAERWLRNPQAAVDGYLQRLETQAAHIEQAADRRLLYQTLYHRPAFLPPRWTEAECVIVHDIFTRISIDFPHRSGPGRMRLNCENSKIRDFPLLREQSPELFGEDGNLVVGPHNILEVFYDLFER